jgi:hypothetical protein
MSQERGFKVADNSLVFDWHKDKDGFLHWALLHLVIDADGSPLTKERVNQISAATDKLTNCKLTVQLNGIELDPTHFFNTMEQAMNASVGEEANALVKQLFNDKWDMVEELNGVLETAKKELQKKLRDMGFQIHEDEW